MEEGSGLWVEMGVGLHVCGGVGAMHVFAKVGGGVEKKIFSLSLRPPPPLFAVACLHTGGVQRGCK